MTMPAPSSEDPREESRGTSLFASATRRLLARPGWSLSVCLLAALASVLLTVGWLEFRTSREDLISPHSRYLGLWKSYRQEFDAEDEVVVLVAAADRATVVRAQQLLAAELRRHPDRFRDVMERFDASRILAKGLYLLPESQLAELAQAVPQLLALVNAPQVDWPRAAAALEKRLPANGKSSRSPWPIGQVTEGLRSQFPDYLFAQQDRLGLVQLRWIQHSQGFIPDGRPAALLQQIARRVESEVPGTRIGVTGLPVLEHAEMETSQRDMSWASLLSVVGVALLFWVGFGGIRDPALAMLTLATGIAWTCGYLTLTVGHLNILSSSFGVILVGLGIDFSIHWIARYRHAVDLGATPTQAILDAATELGAPLWTGGVTTAFAFFSTAFADFVGVSELGWIAGGGVLLCLLATFTALPSALACWERAKWPAHTPPLLPLEKACQPLWRHPGPTVAATLAVTAYLACGLPDISYDFNLLHLQADKLPSVQWELYLMEHTDKSIWYAVSLTRTPEEAIRRKRQFESLPSVERVEEVASLLAATGPARQRQIKALASALSQLPPEPPKHPLGRDLWTQLRELASMAGPEPPRASDIPEIVRRRFIGREGSLALHVFARGDIWDMDSLTPFVREVRSVDPRATGQPLQTYFASHQMRNSFVRAAGLATLAVLLVLIWDLEHPREVLLASLPTVLGLVQLFGLLGHLGIAINPANIIVLPLILGIGVDDAVHVVHNWLLGRTRGESAAHYPDRGVVTGIVLTSLTTMIGFGSLMIAQHQGLFTLGLVASLGVLACLLNSLLVLPCLLEGLRLLGLLPVPQTGDSPSGITSGEPVYERET